MSDRGTGLTTKQMQDAPRDAVFVWCNSHVSYPRALAKALDRADLVVRPLSWLELRNVMGRTFPGLVVDHAAQLDDNSREALHYAILRIRVTPTVRGR